MLLTQTALKDLQATLTELHRGQPPDTPLVPGQHPEACRLNNAVVTSIGSLDTPVRDQLMGMLGWKPLEAFPNHLSLSTVLDALRRLPLAPAS